MKNKINILAALLIAIVPTVKASTLMSYELGEIKSAGVNISSGTVFFISTGTDLTFDSGVFTVGATSIIKSTDSILFATAIVGGVAAGTWTEQYNAPVAVGQTITALFVNGLTSADVNYTTGAFTGGMSILASGGNSIAFGTYRTGSVENLSGLGTGVADAISWVLPANTGATASLLAYSGSGDFAGGNFNASLSTSSAFNLGVAVIPEPSSASLLAFGVAGLVALRVRRKS